MERRYQRLCRTVGAGVELDEADQELDVLHERLTNKVAAGAMSAPVAAQVTLLSRFYERLCDHAVNVARRIQTFPTPTGHAPNQIST